MVSKEYDKPPITEAVIDFRVKAHAVREDLDRVSAKLAGQYKTREPIQDISVQFAPTPAIQAKPAGYRLSSPDQADICILNPEGITTSRLAPYLGWEKLEAMAWANWKVWRKIVGSNTPGRIGVRFINRIDVPFGPVEKVPITEYIKVRIDVPKISDHSWSSFGAQVTVASAAPHWNVNLNAGTVSPPPLVGYVSLLLDIDVWRIDEIPSDLKKQKALLAEARTLKNDLFETFVTDRSRELFDDRGN